MGALADALGNRVAGDLIRAEDWNALIAGIEAADSALQTQITEASAQLNARVDGVDERITVLEGRTSDLEARTTAVEQRVDEVDAVVQDLRDVVTALSERFRRVTLRTERLRFVFGEIAELTARITGLDGAPLTFADAATRPWIDFIAVWGQLKPVPGFETLGGAGDRTISVRVNADGEARVRLRAEHTEGLTDELETDVQASLSTILPSTNLSLAETLLDTATPQEAVQRGAFSVLTNEYDRVDASSIRTFADTYYLRNPIDVAGKVIPIFPHRWQDHRATVLAIGKNDSDPQTPDPSLGVCSIQITFRDWISPWTKIEYFPGAVTLEPDFRRRLGARVDDDLAASADRLKREVEVIIGNKGVIARQRNLQALLEAAGQMEVPGPPPPFLNVLMESVGEGVAIQQVLEHSQATSLGETGPATAFGVFASSRARAAVQGEAVKSELTGLVQETVAEAEQRLETNIVAQQEGLRQDLLRQDGPILRLQTSIEEVAGRVGGVQTELERKADITMLGRFLPQ